ncbi:MAG: hypothetical protein MdMp024_0360 [Bacteroidales bacterium]
MNRIVVIGNGYDLAIGKKTRYSDFIESCKESGELEGNGLFNAFLNDYRNKGWCDCEEVIGEYVYDKCKSVDLDYSVINKTIQEFEAVSNSLLFYIDSVDNVSLNENKKNFALCKVHCATGSIFKQTYPDDYFYTCSRCENDVRESYEPQYVHDIYCTLKNIGSSEDFNIGKSSLVIDLTYTTSMLCHRYHLTDSTLRPSLTPWGNNYIKLHGICCGKNKQIILGYSGKTGSPIRERIEKIGKPGLSKVLKSPSYSTNNIQTIKQFQEKGKYIVVSLGCSFGASDSGLLDLLTKHSNFDSVYVCTGLYCVQGNRDTKIIDDMRKSIDLVSKNIKSFYSGIEIKL